MLFRSFTCFTSKIASFAIVSNGWLRQYKQHVVELALGVISGSGHRVRKLSTMSAVRSVLFTLGMMSAAVLQPLINSVQTRYRRSKLFKRQLVYHPSWSAQVFTIVRNSALDVYGTILSLTQSSLFNLQDVINTTYILRCVHTFSSTGATHLPAWTVFVNNQDIRKVKIQQTVFSLSQLWLYLGLYLIN